MCLPWLVLRPLSAVHSSLSTPHCPLSAIYSAFLPFCFHLAANLYEKLFGLCDSTARKMKLNWPWLCSAAPLHPLLQLHSCRVGGSEAEERGICGCLGASFGSARLVVEQFIIAANWFLSTLNRLLRTYVPRPQTKERERGREGEIIYVSSHVVLHVIY